jgi:hypothetical protein
VAVGEQPVEQQPTGHYRGMPLRRTRRAERGATGRRRSYAVAGQEGSCAGGVQLGEVTAEAVRGAGLAPGRSDNGDRAGLQYPGPSRGQGRNESVILGGRNGGEPSGRQVRGRAEAEIGPVHVTMSDSRIIVAFAEQRGCLHAVTRPVRYLDRADDRVPALVRAADQMTQPARFGRPTAYRALIHTSR